MKLVTGKEETLGNLQPWSNYTVSVAGVTGAGAGVASPDLTCTTDEDGKEFLGFLLQVKLTKDR